MYIDVIDTLINGIKDKTKYLNSVLNDLKVLELLDKIEDSDGGFKR